MSLLNWFKSLFNRSECCCNCCNHHSVDDHVTIQRRNQDITIPLNIYKHLLGEGIRISVTFNKDKKSSTVQLSKIVDGKQKYVGTLKKYMNVKSFKDGNVYNFHKNNIVVKE